MSQHDGPFPPQTQHQLDIYPHSQESPTIGRTQNYHPANNSSPLPSETTRKRYVWSKLFYLYTRGAWYCKRARFLLCGLRLGLSARLFLVLFKPVPLLHLPPPASLPREPHFTAAPSTIIPRPHQTQIAILRRSHFLPRSVLTTCWLLRKPFTSQRLKIHLRDIFHKKN